MIDNVSDNDHPEGSRASTADDPGNTLSRRRFMGSVGGATAGSAVLGGTAVTVLAAVTPAAQAAAIASKSGRRRENAAFKIRLKAAARELARRVVQHPTNGDEERYASRIGNFSKTLPHNDLGEVDPAAYDALLAAIRSGVLADVDAVPAGGLFPLLNPIGGLTFTMDGPDTAAIGINPPPALASAEFAAQLGELYWMALLRDVPFSQYDTHPTALAARADLATYVGYTGPLDPMTGEIRANDLFRVDYPGVGDGPMVSQFLLQPFTYDGIPVEQRISTAAPGADFLTHYGEWLDAQRGFAAGFPPPDPRDPTLRFVRNARDLGRSAGQDTINTAYVKAWLVLQQQFGFFGFPNDAANPYNGNPRQVGFATFGIAHVLELLGKVHKSERHAWFQKWNVHRFLRPEAGSGRVHNVRVGAADYPLHPDLLASPVLDEIFEYNRQQNIARFGIDSGTYLLPQMFTIGAPPHPSFTAGHAISAGACVTVLKAWLNEAAPFPNPKQSSDDGLALEDYVAGVDGPPLTIGGELNKLAHNLSFGRDMSGVHWRADNVEGNAQGEELAIRMLREEVAMYPEPFDGFSLTRFDGDTVTLGR